MFVYKFDVLESLKEAGYNTVRLRKEKLLGKMQYSLYGVAKWLESLRWKRFANFWICNRATL